MITLEQIRTNLITAIKESGLSQTEIAHMLNIKQQAVQQYLSGRAMPALDTFANLCVVLDLDANDILCINDNSNVGYKTYINNSFNNNSNNFGNFKP